jgi:FkbH-like protein
MDLDILPGLLQNPAFQPRFITDESALRRAMYQAEEVRKAAEARFDNNQDFLASLQMRFRILPATIEDLRRVEELTLRTNQLNATGLTFSYDELVALLQSPQHRLYVAELVDKYGTYGKVGVALVECSAERHCIQLLLMSCRVISRGVGGVLLQFLMRQAQASGAELLAEFRHTDRNRQMYMTYKFAGFAVQEKRDDGSELLAYRGVTVGDWPAWVVVDTA